MTAQRLRPLGFSGGLSILKEYLHAVRAQANVPRAYVRMEPASKSTGDTSTRFPIRGMRENFTPSVWWNVTAAKAASGIHTQPEL